MGLFDLKELDDSPQELSRPRGLMLPCGSEQMEVLALDNRESLQIAVQQLQPGKSLHYLSRGLWSMHDLLFRVLELTGPADVALATWTITQEPVQMLVAGMEQGLIRSLSALFDVRVQIRNEDVYYYAQHNIARIGLAVCHAKVTVIENEAWHITINGSANYTNNPRIESGVITESREIAAFHRSWIIDEINQAQRS
ncbi:phospholipase D-like domain-containing protein [Telluribacter humicola]|uniref:hypothetical protein n=1 Tax=Telluribacter humicola TaxID=1720261 RepID=UPI001A972691|nr:hypothetical protein [Telluribacter humicola]